MYTALAEQTTRSCQRAEKKYKRSLQAVAKATKNIKSAAAKAEVAGSKAQKKATKLAQALKRAQATADQDKTAFEEAKNAAAEATKKAVKAVEIKQTIVRDWHALFEKMQNLCKSVESCELYLAPCSKCKGPDCQCTFWYTGCKCFTRDFLHACHRLYELLVYTTQRYVC